VPYASDEHEWTFLIGRRTAASEPVADMLSSFRQLAIRPSSIDASMLTARTVPSLRLRAGASGERHCLPDAASSSD
jgi:hypothetical protein